LITHRFPIERAADAYRLLEDSAARPLGIMFSYKFDKPLSRASIVLRSVQTTAGTGQIRLGVIGAGKFAQTYLLPHLRRPHVRLVALATATAPSASHVARKFGFEQFSCDAENVIADPAINCVLIATRHDLHARLTCAALAAGKAVLVEKPLALTEEELRQLARVARQTGTRLQVGFNRRFSPLAQWVREYFHQRQGSLVLTYRVNAAPLPPQHWVYDPVEGGGRIRSEVCHFIDLLSFFAGAPPVRVYAEPMQDLAASLRENENLTISLKFSDGSTGSVTYTTLGQAGLDRERIEVFGGHRAAHIDNFRRAHLHQGNRRRRIRHWRQNLGYREELSAFLSAVATGASMPIPLDDLLATSLATLRVVESLQRRQPVEVNLAALDSQHD
jgi:predicted dehydrogenase